MRRARRVAAAARIAALALLGAAGLACPSSAGLDPGSTYDAGEQADAGPPFDAIAADVEPTDAAPDATGASDGTAPSDAGGMDRARAILQAEHDAPNPSPNDADPDRAAWGTEAWSIASLALGVDVAEANDRLAKLHDSDLGAFAGDGGAAFGGQNVPAFFGLTLLPRLYGTPAIASQLRPDVRAAIGDILWTVVRSRSRLVDAHGPPLDMYGSENKDATWRATFLVATELLAADAAYGPTRTLDDGHTLAEHASAWEDHWARYFRGRAANGVLVEMASPTYAEYTLSAYLAVADLCTRPVVAAYAQRFVTLVLADAAQDFLPGAAARGGARTRMYKESPDVTRAFDPMSVYFWLYGWHDTTPGGLGDAGPAAGPNPGALAGALSAYRPPAVVTAIARGARLPYVYDSRRIGLGTTDPSTGNGNLQDATHHVVFDDGGASHVLRRSRVTPSYVLGALAFAPGAGYVAIVDENRASGALFADGSLITVFGEGTDQCGNGAPRDAAPCRTSFADVQSVVAGDALVVARDPRATLSVGPRIFVSRALWATREVDGDWTFVHNATAFAAIAAPGASLKPGAPFLWNQTTTADGTVIDVRTADGTAVDASAPVLLQLGEASGGTYADFVARVTATAPQRDDVAHRLTWTAVDGSAWVVALDGSAVPTVNGAPLDLDPPMTFSSPYLVGANGDASVTIRYPGEADLTLGFGP